jgi:patatin-related protein
MESSTATAGDGRTKELRLAIVCYGGSSLAVYMHGVTKELNRLVKGSVIPPGAGTASEQTYGKLLDALAERDQGVRTRVVVDVIAGTSAGGINGICLAKALAHNRSQDELRDLWFEHGDIDGLLNAPKNLPRKLKFAWVAARGLWSQPLKGDVMAKWVYDAFTRMDEQDPDPGDVTSLLPNRHLLELFVTVTDFFGYGRQVPYADPNPIEDTRHRHLLTFRYGGDERRDDFGSGSNGALTFAARTTSCIPGVFPPVSLGKLREWLGSSRPVDLDDLKRRFFRLYDLAGFDAATTWFVDGGVLDNKPFGPAIEAIRECPAGVEVDRRLLYLEPDPGAGPRPPTKPYEPPGTVGGAVGGLTGLPRAEPILDDLVEVGALNERVRRVKDIIESSWGDVEQRVLALTGPIPTLPDDPASPELAHLRALLDEEARTSAGFSYTTYVRLKISGVVDRYAETACAVCDLPPDSTHALLARSVLRTWARRKCLFEKQVEPTPKQLDFLISFDLDYGERRLRFVIDGLNHLYERDDAPPRAQIDAAKARVWKAVHDLRDAMSGTEFDEELSGRYTTCFPVDAMREFMQKTGFDAGEYLDEGEHAKELDALEVALAKFLDAKLKGLTGQLYKDLLGLTGTGDWTDKQRRDLLVRYLGFPFWDILLYPIQALSDVGERDEVQIVRMSPRDTHRIPNPNAPGKKLVGAEEHHFGAFLSHRGGREKDYLWGRLDGAERLIGILVRDEADRARWCKEAFGAILAEDERAVPNARDLVRHVRGVIGG